MLILMLILMLMIMLSMRFVSKILFFQILIPPLTRLFAKLERQNQNQSSAGLLMGNH